MTAVSRQPETHRRGSILLVGVGALGCSALAVLARSRVAAVTFIDPDVVEASNLPPQFLYTPSDVGSRKVRAAKARLSDSDVVLNPVEDRLSEANAPEFIGSHDFVIDACDDPPTKFLLNRVAVAAGRPFSYAGLSRTGGLALTVVPRLSACLACVFPDAAYQESRQRADPEGFGCHQTGIVAPVAAVVGAFQALQALALLGLSRGAPSHGLTVYQLRGRRWKSIDVVRDPRCTVCGGNAQANLGRRIESCHS